MKGTSLCIQFNHSHQAGTKALMLQMLILFPFTEYVLLENIINYEQLCVFSFVKDKVGELFSCSFQKTKASHTVLYS